MAEGYLTDRIITSDKLWRIPLASHELTPSDLSQTTRNCLQAISEEFTKITHGDSEAVVQVSSKYALFEYAIHDHPDYWVLTRQDDRYVVVRATPQVFAMLETLLTGEGFCYDIPAHCLLRIDPFGDV